MLEKSDSIYSYSRGHRETMSMPALLAIATYNYNSIAETIIYIATYIIYHIWIDL